MFSDIDKLLNANPGLTGREIAKHLGLDKKKVNSFLSKKEIFLIRIRITSGSSQKTELLFLLCLLINGLLRTTLRKLLPKRGIL